ncbi:MAG TPA: serine hydrolase domain-containing protein [Kofleriaceae bacterium]|nr:serine hydrolase domain-containing protein [Kofleriaceae bacterium]
MKVAAACVAAVLAIAVSSVAAAEAPPRNLDELRARIAGVLLRERVPGAGIALVDDDGIVWAGGVGVADRARGRPVTADTLFRVGSITKSFIGLAFLRLAERGRIDLRARVSDLAPELAIGNRWAREQPITVAHLLEHTAGFDDMHPNEMYSPLAAEAMPLAAVLARNPASRVARWRPGSRMSYANPGYTVAGYVLEKITGRPYEEVLERELLEPLGMTSAALRLTPEVDARLSRGYDEGEDAIPYRAIYHRPAGNLMASPRELAALVQLGLARGRYGGRTLVSPASMARFERSETARLDAGDASYGLGNYGDVSERAVIRGHNGGVDGFLSSYGYLPDHGVGYVLLLNSTGSLRAVDAIRHLLVEYLLTGAHVPPPPRAAVPEDELRRWTGTYHTAAPRHQLLAFIERMLPGIELFVDGGRLYARQVPGEGPQIELVPLGGDRFRLPSASASHITFGRDREGRRILVAGGAYFVEEPRSRSVAYCLAPVICLSILGTGWLFIFGLFRRRVGPTPSAALPLCTTLSLFALPRLFLAAVDATVLGELNLYTLGVFVLSLVFALGSMATMVQALQWLPRPGSIIGKLHRLVFAAAACLTTAYLTAYGIIGIRLWSY